MHITRISTLPEEQAFRPLVLITETRVLTGIIKWSIPIGLLVAFVAFQYGPYLITLDFRTVSHKSIDYWSVRFLFVVLVVPTIFLGWWIVVVAEKRMMSKRRLVVLPIGVFLSIVVVLLLAVVFSSPTIQWFFLEAIKVRAEPFSLQRSIAYWKSGQDSGNTGRKETVMALVGSSQINMAVDDRDLGKAIPELKIEKNALPGFGVLQYLMVLPALKKQHAKIVVVILSEFDTFRDDHIPAERLRYFGGLKQKLTLMSILPNKMVWKNRGAFADLFMASISPFWRDRDLFKILLYHFWWKPETAENGHRKKENDIARIMAHADVLKKSIGQTTMVDTNFVSFESFASELIKLGIRLYVFEGMTNSLAKNRYDPNSEFRVSTRIRLTKMSRRVGFSYVQENEMPHFESTDFSDAVHLNSAARKRFTEYLGFYLKKNDPALTNKGKRLK